MNCVLVVRILSFVRFVCVPFQSAMPWPAPREIGWPRWGHSVGFCLWRPGNYHLFEKRARRHLENRKWYCDCQVLNYISSLPALSKKMQNWMGCTKRCWPLHYGKHWMKWKVLIFLNSNAITCQVCPRFHDIKHTLNLVIVILFDMDWTLLSQILSSLFTEHWFSVGHLAWLFAAASSWPGSPRERVRCWPVPAASPSRSEIGGKKIEFAFGCWMNLSFSSFPHCAPADWHGLCI